MRPGRVRDDAGGVWIVTGWVLGFLVYVGIVVAWHAGFTGATPFVVIPPVLLIMVGAGNLISGRRSGRPARGSTDPTPCRWPRYGASRSRPPTPRRRRRRRYAGGGPGPGR